MRWMLLLCLSLSLPALADLDYALSPRQIADEVCDVIAYGLAAR